METPLINVPKIFKINMFQRAQVWQKIKKNVIYALNGRINIIYHRNTILIQTINIILLRL